MRDVFSPKLDILPPAQKAMWNDLRGAASLGFVLYGGTAVALRLGHRRSVDFDFFSDRELDKARLRRALPILREAQVLQNSENTYTVVRGGLGRQSVKLSFFGAIGFGRVGRPEWTSDRVVLAASLMDLLATKLAVLQQRVAARDYQDIAALVRAGLDLGRGLASARALYGLSFQPSESLKALTYFEGGDLDTLGELDRKLLVEVVRNVEELPRVKRNSRSLSLKRKEAK